MAQDIYFSENYGRLYESAEQGKAVCWRYEGREGCVEHQFILRRVPQELSTEPLYDIVTPYGYGGPLMTAVNEGYSKAELEAAFEKSFSDYCIANRIVCEFVRFHPVAANGPDFKRVYDSTMIRHTVGTSLLADDPVGAEFGRETRRRIRRALEKGVTLSVTRAPRDLSAFQRVYYETMERNRAEDYYYFDDGYFADCLRYFSENVLLVEAVFEGELIGAGLYFVFDKYLHIHLTGTRSSFMHLTPAYLLHYAAVAWGKENGCELVHYGGGRSNREDDDLYVFKKQFGKNTTFDFYVGKRIWSRADYDALCARAGVSPDGDFFPAYRSHR